MLTHKGNVYNNKNKKVICFPVYTYTLRLRLHGIGYVQIRLGSDPLGRDLLCLHGTGSKLERNGCIWDHLHKWTYLVPDSRSDPYRIHQVPCKHKAYSYQFRTGSKRIRSNVNAALIVSQQRGSSILLHCVPQLARWITSQFFNWTIADKCGGGMFFLFWGLSKSASGQRQKTLKIYIELRQCS